MTTVQPTSVAGVTGASRGLGLALGRALADRGWSLVIDARGAATLAAAAADLRGRGNGDVIAIPGDVADPDHPRAWIGAAGEGWGRLDALVNNASILGPSPQPPLGDYPLDV